MIKITIVICTILQIYVMADNSVPRVCIIGAGIAGLTSAKYLKEERISFTVLEATKYIGGTWRYDERVGVDENGLPIHTSMYKHLRTNLPKPTMELLGFPIPKEYPSFPTREMYFNYIKAYAKLFDLEKYVKFLHYVVHVKRLQNKWRVKYKHISSQAEYEEDYEYVIIGSGHHSTPNNPIIPGEKIFKGTIIHSHDYRVLDPYKYRRVLIVGAGPSGMDISLDVAEVSKTLVHSHHSKVKFNTPFPPHYIKKPDIKEFNETGVTFIDGSYEEIDDVIYCTGYQYSYPFLDESSVLTITPQSVTPLYKYMVNINQPSMIFMGLIVRACIVVAIDTQARYATALIKGNFTLPSRKEMMAEWQRSVDALRSSGRPISHIHLLAEKEDQYYEELTNQSGIMRVPPVMFKIRTLDTQAKLDNLYTYRNYTYEVLDNENFVRRLET
ncbi:hypothetical protein evm_007878 [Chilo suppressalis]|nr:hypothetical protein evm_007878 [Chilo suppressalis]